MKKYLLEIVALSLMIVSLVFAIGVAVVKVNYPIAYQSQIEF